MNSVLLKKLKESLVSVIPIVAIVFFLNLTPIINFSTSEITVFLISAVFLILGIALFNLGADLAMTPMGEHIGSGLTKLKSLSLLLSVCLCMGILITVAEPDLTVLANQVSNIMNPKMLIFTVGGGVGMLLVISVLKIVTRMPLAKLLMFFYMFLFALTSILITTGNADLIPMGFDSGGVTTGPITVPFIMALGVGIATTIGGKDASENSFGLIALCSVGPILAVILLGCTVSGEMPPYDTNQYLLNYEFLHILHVIAETAKEVLIALGLIVLFFVVLQIAVLKLPKKRLLQIGIGALITYAGLVIFLSAVHVGFMPIGYKMGQNLAEGHPLLLCAAAFILGLVVVLAEPAVHVLKKQVSDVTDGGVSDKAMLIALSVGVGISLCLSAIRIVFDFSVLYYLIPGYFLSLGLSFFVPKMYTAIAFDSGGVASGPLTSTFILPFAIGACMALEPSGSSVLQNGFGIVAMVAMTPLITIQLLGFRSVMARKMREEHAIRRILSAEDGQIIEFT